NLDQCRMGCRPAASEQFSRQLFRGCFLEEHRDGQFQVKFPLNLRHQANSDQGVSAQIEEAVLDANRLDLQKTFPDAYQSGFDLALRCSMRPGACLEATRYR